MNWSSVAWFLLSQTEAHKKKQKKKTRRSKEKHVCLWLTFMWFCLMLGRTWPPHCHRQVGHWWLKWNLKNHHDNAKFISRKRLEICLLTPHSCCQRVKIPLWTLSQRGPEIYIKLVYNWQCLYVVCNWKHCVQLKQLIVTFFFFAF